MHTAKLNMPADFEIEVGGRSTDLHGLFPDLTPTDRFGIVVDDLLGGLGAALLIDAAVVGFFEADPRRREESPVYPEIYLFHVGGPQGDFGAFDFWPPRKEVIVAADDPVALLAEINGRAVTRLALPEAEPGDAERLTTGLSTWAEQAAARERLRSCFVYSPSGLLADADVRIASGEASIEANPELALWPIPVIEEVEEHLEDPDYLPGLSIPADNTRYIDHTLARLDEVPKALRDELIARRAADREAAGGKRVETYRRVDTEEALLQIAGI
jgi:hypothetical protein